MNEFEEEKENLSAKTSLGKLEGCHGESAFLLLLLNQGN